MVKAKTGGKAAAEEKVEKKKVKSSNRPTSLRMIQEALRALGERGGSSFYAIKKHIEGQYSLDMKTQGNFLRKALKKGIEDNVVIQVTGPKGSLSGSYKLPSKSTGTAQSTESSKKPAVKKPIAATRKTAPSKTVANKKKPAESKASTTAAKSSSPVKAKKAAKAPAKKAAKPAKVKLPAKKK